MRLGPLEISRRAVGFSDNGEPDFGQLLRENDLVEVTPEGVVILAERPKQLAVTSEGRAMVRRAEIGSAGKSTWVNMAREDYNPALAGQMGYKKFDEMRRNDAQVRATLRLIKTPVLGARWYVEPVSVKKQDQTIAKFVENNLFHWMTVSWPQLLTESLLMLDFGWYSFEKVYDFRENQIILRKLAPRHPMDCIDWEYDSYGGPKGAFFYGPGATSEQVFIPIEKLVAFTFDKEGGNITGISVLRSAYKHWYYKENLYKIDAIQKERHGIGVPIIKLPVQFDETDKQLAHEMGRNLRTNEKAHVVLPPMWELTFAKLEGQPVNVIESIEHHDLQIARNVLGQFINTRFTGDVEGQQEMFMKATRFIADIIRDAFNKWVIPQLVNFNWPNVEDYPELRVRRIGENVDHRQLSFALRNYIGAAAIVPDDVLEDYLRDEMDLPQRDPETAREVATPQLPESGEDEEQDDNNTAGRTEQGRAGLPRQSPASGRRNRPGNASAGRDGNGNSGGTA